MKLFIEKARVSRDRIAQIGSILEPSIAEVSRIHRDGGYERPEGFINLPEDERSRSALIDLARAKAGDDLKYVVVIGIGGSNLGAKAVYEALYGYADCVEPDRFPKMLWADTCDPEYSEKLARLLDARVTQPEEALFVIVSKSGGTTETIANAEFFLNVFAKKFGKRFDRVVIISDEDSRLWREARELGIDCLQIPANVGGRYSVCSSAGLFPLAAVGIDVSEFARGAKEETERCLALNILENPAGLASAVLFEHASNGIRIHDLFLFHQELESAGKWYRQLLAESCGKERDLAGAVARAGITPTVSVGSVDLHSMAQLSLAGPRDKVTTFVCAEDSAHDAAVPDSRFLAPESDPVHGKKFQEIMWAIFGGTRLAYEQQELPFMEIILPDLSAGSLGAFMQFQMMATIYLGKLLNINPFNQPAVELYKQETRRLLSASL